MASTFEVDFEPLQFSISASDSNSPLISFNNEMNAFQQECDKLKVLYNFANSEPLISAASQLVFKLNKLFTTFLRDFYSSLKWSRIHCEKQRMELLEHVQKWHRESQQHVDFLCNFSFQSQAQETLKAVKSSLLYNSVVTNLQPPRALKRDTLFDTSLRFFYDNKNKEQNETGAGNGNQTEDGQISPFKIFLLDEAEALKLFQNWEAGNLNPRSSPPSVVLGLEETRDILRNKRNCGKRRKIEHQDLKNTAFKKLKWDWPKHFMNKHEKCFCLLYLKTVEINGVAMETWCVSLPVVLLLEYVVKCYVQATLFWYSYFKREENWLPFQVKEETNWKDLSLALIDYFKSETKTEWNLTPENLKYIGKKIFQTGSFHDNSVVKRQEFCQVNGRMRKMTSWRWLFSIVELIQRYLAPFWNSGAIVGFIDQVEAEKLIRSQEQGTFLIRFSDDLVGGISYIIAIAPTPDDLKKGYRSSAQSSAPLDYSYGIGLNDLSLLSLDQRIMTNNQFTDVLYFDPSLNYKEVLEPKEAKFTLSSLQDEENEGNGTGNKS